MKEAVLPRPLFTFLPREGSSISQAIAHLPPSEGSNLSQAGSQSGALLHSREGSNASQASSSQATAHLPPREVSSISQAIAHLPSGEGSNSSQATAHFPPSEVSSISQAIAYHPSGEGSNSPPSHCTPSSQGSKHFRPHISTCISVSFQT